MREWNLGLSDPMVLTLSSDFRLCTPDYVNDQIWELELGGGDPPAISLRTTYGLRARQMRIFPRFHLLGQVINDPLSFATPPILKNFTPNFILIKFSPYRGLDVVAEYWIPDSHSASGRFSVINHTGEPISLLFELCGQLVPMGGLPLAAIPMQSANVLAGRSMDIAPVLFLTGGPLPGPGPYPSLTIDMALASGGSRTLTWTQAALPTIAESFDLARRTASRHWDAERARLEMVNASEIVDVHTGDEDWDAAFAFTQKIGFGLFFGASPHLPHPSFVLSRQPDQGYSHRFDGSDYSHLWNGQPALEANYLMGNLPGASGLIPGLIRNFLTTQLPTGKVDWKPGLAGQLGHWQATPLLVNLAWQYANRSGDKEFLLEVFSRLNAFLRQWLHSSNDRDADGFPEWTHPNQSGLENHPLFSIWHPQSQGADISCVETPSLPAMLFKEFQILSHIGREINMPGSAEELQAVAASLRSLVEDCWDSTNSLYHIRDRDSHLWMHGKTLASQNGPGTLSTRQSFSSPTRLIIEIEFKGESIRHPQVVILGETLDSEQTIRLERQDFLWGAGRGVATLQRPLIGFASVDITGIEKRDKVSLMVMDLSSEDISLFLPLWAKIPSKERARSIIHRSLLSADQFWKPFGIPSACSHNIFPLTFSQAVDLPLNSLIGEGMLAYGFRYEAAQLIARLMTAIIGNLKRQHAFYRSYDAETGAGLGERNSVAGLAPLGMFLQILGVDFHSEKWVTISGKNPFPWPVTVKYRSLRVTRDMEKTIIVFPDEQVVILDDPSDVEILAE